MPAPRSTGGRHSMISKSFTSRCIFNDVLHLQHELASPPKLVNAEFPQILLCDRAQHKSVHFLTPENISDLRWERPRCAPRTDFLDAPPLQGRTRRCTIVKRCLSAHFVSVSRGIGVGPLASTSRGGITLGGRTAVGRLHALRTRLHGWRLQCGHTRVAWRPPTHRILITRHRAPPQWRWVSRRSFARTTGRRRLNTWNCVVLELTAKICPAC
mmetsp:Transcript_7760/g.21236  ORF Transcript_7760/g.21236 Transcript_7760/m.21236 type:complete len:213 (-) Transcript_7760:548-1186(-)